MKTYFLVLFIAIFYIPPNECLQRYLEDAQYDLKKEDYEEVITSYQDAIQNCQLTLKERSDVLSRLSEVYNIINQTINEERDAALNARDAAKKAKTTADSNKRKAERAALQSEARRLASLADREEGNKILKLKLACEAMYLMDSSKTKLPNVLLAFGDAVRDSFLTIQHFSKEVIGDLISVENQLIIAQGNRLSFLKDGLIQQVGKQQAYILSLQEIDNQIITTAKDGSLQVWDKQGKLRTTSTAHKESINFLRFNNKKSQVLTGGNDHQTILWSSNAKKLKIMPHTAKVLDGDFSADGQRIFTRTQDKKVYLWETGLPKEISADAFIYDAAFLKNGTFLVTVDATGTVKQFDVNGQAITDYQLEKNPAIDIIMGPKKEYFLVLFADGTGVLAKATLGVIKEFMSNGLNLKNKRTPYIPFKKATFSPLGEIFAVSFSNKVQLINLEGIIKTSFLQAYTITDLQFSADGQYILTTATDYSLKIYNLQGQLILDINKLQSPILKAFFSEDNQKIIAYTKKGRIISCPLPATYKHLKSNLPLWTPSEIDKFDLSH